MGFFIHNKKRLRAVSAIVVFVYLFMTLSAFMPSQQVYAGSKPKSQTQSQSKPASNAKTSNYKPSNSAPPKTYSAPAKPSNSTPPKPTYSAPSNTKSNTTSISKTNTTSTPAKSNSNSNNSGGGFKGFVSSTANKVSNATKSVTTAAKNTVSNATSKVITATKSVTTVAKNTVNNAAKTVTTATKNVATAAKKTVSNATSKVTTATKSVTTVAKNTVNNATKTVTNGMKTVTNGAKNLATNIGKTVTTATKNISSTVKNTASNVTKSLNNTTKTVANSIKNTVQKVGQSANNSLKSITGTVKNKVTTTLNNAKNKIVAIGSNVTRGVATAASSVKNKLVATAANVKTKVTTTVANVKTNATTVFNNLKSGVKLAAQSIQSGASKSLQKGKDAVTRYATHFRQGAASVGKAFKNAGAKVVAAGPRIWQGTMGTLQIIGGGAQVLGGVALCKTGIGALVGVPVVAHGLSDIVQGFQDVKNAISGNDKQGTNYLQKGYKATGGFVGKLLGNEEKGKKIGNAVFYVMDIGTSLVNAGAWVDHITNLKKMDKASDMMKYTKQLANNNLVKGWNTVKSIPQKLTSLPSAGKKLLTNVKNIPASTTKKFTAIKSTVVKHSDMLGQAWKNSKPAKNTMIFGINGAGEAQKLYDRVVGTVKEYSSIKKKVAASLVNNPYDEFLQMNSGKDRYEYLLNKVETADVATNKNQAIFYSGRWETANGTMTAREWAEAYAKRSNKITLEMTSGGKWLDELGLYNNEYYKELELTLDQVNYLWGRISQRYAQEATGAVTAFAKSVPQKFREKTIFWTKELAELRNNSKVKHINIR